MKPAFDEDDARRLVELVGDHVEAVMDFRVFADSKPAKARMSKLFRDGAQLPRMKWRDTIGELMPTLQKRNAQGCGVYYSLNESNGKGVKNANIKAVRVVPLDLDETAPPDLWDIEPHMVMESSPGRHQALFMIEPTTDFDLAQSVTKRMAVKFGGDPNVSDRARVFRMPGFRHQKAAPFTSRILQIDHFKRRYTLPELDSLLPPLPRRFVNSNDMGIGTIGVDKAKLLFENLDVECLSGNEKWQRFAMALHSACNADEEVAELFFDFCGTGDGYGDEDTDARNRLRWESFDASREGGVGIGTLRHMCLQFRVPGLVCFELFNTAARDFDDE
ncbi:PriCT-2 domain-containing protein [Bradyrhizobium sp. 200]|uniref:DNA-primase RepB domain-containing protein n=1 Tax=Bradyrhizobium sp. 200 TaxID=2782665 RepID=UPI001FFFE6D6|nr:DNA-primase RepB domain-containing protein [Bradyrhizobium sp. 200]UPJ50784.1 PriCT-2 domain-containing protein [Bradyrhizobium sp. 200]